MKKYNKPEIEIIVTKVQDIIAASSVPTLINGGGNGKAQSESFSSIFGQ